MTTPLKYDATAKWLHWLIGVIVIVMLVAGRTLEALPLDERTQIIMVHSGLGTLVLVLMIVRLAWRRSHTPPGPTAEMSVRQIRLSLWMHHGLYALFILQPLLGIAQAMFITDYEIVAFGLIDYSGLAENDAGLARTFHILHGLNSLILSLLVIGHILAAFYHHFLQKDDVMRRMLPFGKVES
ncbi:MAG: cytochrome b/b6 domain-containing protein [Pseudomonadales bacterium]|jgi:cytochrome b561|nr:cytochrome b/b6 domain-containing protein [Pseudomonadales bacterium]MDP6472794.1 cytochrome b/b6 domain-containing protein [Pseudomonadales bacterium]MDP6828008.1 cytochrome b/b6 domain-containing protein [Pseudomonadales bacterium]MDP6970590.1 cytochrome b/b6 domain-containing protein [Pseudomonadales bacterium]|tara:strand:+ start:477 stop:1025 length:549 start_codon:yes stop_codon:yes gene_type:complete